jgi:putative ABC transport system substrate-binding protein
LLVVWPLTIPIVFVGSSDPVRTGLVASLNQPGGNVTGAVFTSSDLAAKRLGLLHDLVPKSVAIATLFHPAAPGAELYMEEVEKAGQTIGRQLLTVKVTDESEFHDAFATMVQKGANGLLIGSSPYFLSRRRQLAALALRYALPFLRSPSQLRRGRRPYELRIKPSRCLSSCWHLRWPHSQGCDTRQYAG